jgi:hypothetical protein
MGMIHEVNQVLIVNTEFGEAQVLFIIDYGIHVNSIWVCASFEDGRIRHYDTNQITIVKNCTMDFNIKKVNGK